MDLVLDILGKIGFEPKQALLSLVNFGIIYFIMAKFVFPKLGEAIKARQEQAKKYIENSQLVEAKLQEAQRDAKVALEEADNKAITIVEDAHKKAKDMEEQMYKDAEKRIENMIEQGRRSIEQEREKMQAELKEQTVDIVMQVTKKVLGDRVDADVDTNYIKSALDDIK